MPGTPKTIKFIKKSRKCLNQISIGCSALLQQTFEFSRQKWQQQKCDSTNRFAHPLALICDINQESALKNLPCTQLLSGYTHFWQTLYVLVAMLCQKSSRKSTSQVSLCLIRDSYYRQFVIGHVSFRRTQEDPHCVKILKKVPLSQ